MASARHLVVVAHTEPAAVDELADDLRAEYTVRTAYDAETLVETLDDGVDVVLVDPALPDVGLRGLRERRRTDELCYGIGALTAFGRPSEPAAVDAVVEPSARNAVLRDAVELLAEQATYRRLLNRYYAVASERAALLSGESDPQTGSDERTERRRLDERLERIRAELDDAREALDTETVFAVALEKPGDGYSVSEESGDR